LFRQAFEQYSVLNLRLLKQPYKVLNVFIEYL